MDLKLKINGIRLEPGDRLEPEALLENGFKREGMLQRLLHRSSQGGDLYKAANTEVDCFEDAFNLYPCTASYLTRDRQWETAATVLLVDGRVNRVTFHVLDGIYAAPNYVTKFKEICTKLYGEPGQGPAGAMLWKNDKVILSGKLQPDGICADFRMETGT